MTTLKNLFLAAILSLPCCVLGQNHEGRNDQIYYQESPGVYRIAKFDGVYAIDETLHATTHDPEFFVQRKGENYWSPKSYQWLKYLGTDGKIWQTRTHANNFGSGKYKIWLESQRPNGDGDNPTWQFIDWDGNPWTVLGLSAKPLAQGREDDHTSVYFILRKGK